ncbi:MAG: hypothetical protein ACLVEU_03105 [Bacteroides cellulosilyticus]
MHNSDKGMLEGTHGERAIGNSATGVAGELGGILRFGKFCISAGFHTVNFKYHEATAGVGFVF